LNEPKLDAPLQALLDTVPLHHLPDLLNAPVTSTQVKDSMTVGTHWTQALDWIDNVLTMYLQQWQEVQNILT
jgi:hypothetical protein